MIICSCNVLTESQISRILDQADERGLKTPGQVYRCFDCVVGCGRCLITIRRMMRERCAAATCPCCLAQASETDERAFAVAAE